MPWGVPSALAVAPVRAGKVLGEPIPRRLGAAPTRPASGRVRDSVVDSLRLAAHRGVGRGLG